MRSEHYNMTANDIYRFAAAMLQPQLKWHDHGPKCTAPVLLQILFYAAAQLCSVFAACARLRTAPSDQAVRDALAALCPEESGVLEEQFNQSFAEQLPKGLKKRSQRLAIDLTLVPYHGQPYRCSEEIYRSQAKSGTTHFHAYATCYVVHKGRRFTVAMMRVDHGTTMVAVLKRLLRQARRAGIRRSLLLLDRGFYSVKVIRYLQAARYAFIMPVIIRGRDAHDPRGPSATRVFAVQKHRAWAKYTLTNSEKIKATVRICVHCRNWAGHRKRRGRQTLVYAFWAIQPKTTEWVYQIYRLRFGIETSYRQLNEARIKTTTRNPQLRLLFIGIALVLRNLWVWVHWHYLASPRRGGRKLNLYKLRFKTLLMWLTHFAENTFGLDDAVLAERSP